MSTLKVLRDLTYRYPFLKSLLFPILFFRARFNSIGYYYRDQVYQNVKRILADDLIVRNEQFRGNFVVGKKSDLFKRLVFFGEYEPEIAALCLKYVDKSRDVVDVGANIGFFTVLFAKVIEDERKVLAIEPISQALERLHQNIRLNEVERKVIVFEGAASNSGKPVEMKVVDGREEYSTLGLMNHPSVIKANHITQQAQASTLDDLVSLHSLDPKLVKLDVEGTENLVLQGSPRILSRHRPIIVSEISPYLLKRNGGSFEEILDLLRRHEYVFFDPASPGVPVGRKTFGNILCIPREKKAT
jgi:FkbM family methyltransferase